MRNKCIRRSYRYERIWRSRLTRISSPGCGLRLCVSSCTVIPGQSMEVILKFSKIILYYLSALRFVLETVWLQTIGRFTYIMHGDSHANFAADEDDARFNFDFGSHQCKELRQRSFNELCRVATALRYSILS